MEGHELRNESAASGNMPMVHPVGGVSQRKKSSGITMKFHAIEIEGLI